MAIPRALWLSLAILGHPQDSLPISKYFWGSLSVPDHPETYLEGL